MTDWTLIKQELAIWRQRGLKLEIWWRDDDAVAQTTILDRLMELSVTLIVPCHLAVIPKYADQTLAATCQSEPTLVPLVHGWAHANHANAGQKKSEFGQQRAELVQDAAAGLTRMQHLFGDNFLPCFVPPWNRTTPQLSKHLPALGYSALSTYTPRLAREVLPGLVQINTHIDPINWKEGGGVVSSDRMIQHILKLLQDRRNGRTDLCEPLGLLTHHLVHDEDIWAFVKDCLATFLDAGAIPVNLLELRDNLP